MAKQRRQLDDYKPDPRLIDERGATEQRFRMAEGQFFPSDTGAIHLRDSPIERAITKQVLSREQGEAAQKYYIHWYRGGMAGQLHSIEIERIFGGRSPDHLAGSENAIFHRQRYWLAAKLLGRDRPFFEAIVLQDKPFQWIGFEKGWENDRQAYAVGVELMRDALDRLCSTWGIISKST